MKSVAFIIAMEQEAQYLINQLELNKVTPSWEASFPHQLYQGIYNNLSISIITNGEIEPNVQYVGTNGALVSSMLLKQYLETDYIINMGTCGSWKSQGSAIADIYWVNKTSFHDRRIPIPGYQEFGQSNLACPELPQDIAQYFKQANLSTGNSLDILKQDQEIIFQNKAILKDMEGAAINEFFSLLGKNVIFLKGVTDHIDSTLETEEEFFSNLKKTCENLTNKAIKVLDYLGERHDRL